MFLLVRNSVSPNIMANINSPVMIHVTVGLASFTREEDILGLSLRYHKYDISAIISVIFK
jgi:hypothetical protein